MGQHINSRLQKLGLTVHEVSVASTSGEFIGLEFSHNSFSVKRARLWRLRFALDRLLQIRNASPKLLEILVGHITWIMMVRRESLALLNRCYRFIHRDNPESVNLPFDVTSELENIRNLLPLLRASCAATWCPTLHAADASGTGLGVCYSPSSPDEVGGLGRMLEKWRVRSEDAICARRSALGVTLPGRVDDVLLDYLDQHSKPLATAQLLDIDPDIKDSILHFNEIPGKILDPSRWKVCFFLPT